MLISHKHRFIFFACGKTGTTSIEAALKQYDEGGPVKQEIERQLRSSGRLIKPGVKLSRTIKHIAPQLFRELVPDDMWNGYYKFVFVRNPWDWMVSQYFFNFKAGYLKRRGLVKLTAADVDRVREKLRTLKTVRTETRAAEGGFQYRFTVDADGAPLVDYVGRFENLRDDYRTICRNIGIETVDLPALNTSGHRQYRKHYNAASREAVYKAYWKDVEVLGYRF